MIQMTFFLKYQSQLKRIRPNIYNKLKQSVVDNIKLFGGNVKFEHHAIIAFFDEGVIGFWLDILSVIENLQKTLNAGKKELYGHICILSEVIDDEQMLRLLNTLPFVKIVSGIWCTRPVKKHLECFFEFKKTYKAEPCLTYRENEKNIEELQDKKMLTAIRDTYLPHQRIHSLFYKNTPGGDAVPENTVLTGRDFTGKRGYLHWLCSSQKITPVTVRFGSWGAALNCFSDALSPELRRFIESVNVEITEEINSLYDMLFTERLRGEYSGYTLKKAERFWKLLLESYHAAVSEKEFPGVIILENIQNADANMRQLVMNYRSFYKEKKLVVYATCGVPDLAEEWKDMFTSVINCPEAEDSTVLTEGVLSPSLLDTAYSCNILGRYFPAYLFLNLFLEEGKNPASIDRSLDILLKYGVIRSKQDPESEIHRFIQSAEELLGKRVVYIRGMAARILVRWYAKGRLKPCFNLLEAIYGLGGEISPILALEAVRQDVINGTYRDIDRAIAEKRFDKICGPDRSPVLWYIYKTLKTLIYEDEAEIINTFSALHIPETEISNYRAQVLTINAFYKLGTHDPPTAFEEIKEAMIICQENRNRYGIAQVYRMFAFIYLSRNELNHAIDYLTFAIEDSECGKNNVELALSSYYAANCHFIYGNISKAQRLIKQAEHTANISGMEEWTMRSRFVSGRFYFETGDYGNALEVFNSLHEYYAGGPFSNQSQTICAWIFRTELYLYGKTMEHPEFISGDGQLFEAEAAYLSGDYEKTLELSERLLSSLPDDGFLFLEQPDWSSGFAQCELLQTSKKDLWTRITTAWRTLALSMLSAKNSEEASHIIQKFIRDKFSGEMDPNAPFYFFVNYKILCQMNAAEVDRNTAISIAFKRLQRRSSRIDDIDIRQGFLSNQYWNKLLYSTAKEHKLI